MKNATCVRASRLMAPGNCSASEGESRLSTALLIRPARTRSRFGTAISSSSLNLSSRQVDQIVLAVTAGLLRNG